MNCAWQELLAILPPWLAREADLKGRDSLQELRLRIGQPVQMILNGGSMWLNRNVTAEDLNFCVNIASKYSPWAAQSISRGYITAPGGHRIGLCGETVTQNGCMTGIRTVRSVCIRVAKDFPGIGQAAAQMRGSILLLGPPGSGKTTLLRDMIRQISQTQTVAVVDERGELFPEGCFTGGKAMDVLTGCGKAQGIDAVIRTMGPDVIAVDEITAAQDCEALLQAGWCGVRILATAHASSVQDLRARPLYRPLMEKHLFDHIIVLSRDKSWREEELYL